jgi:GTP-binding protein
MPIRNIAIIAHVDHGKTTLLDNILKQSHTFRENQATDERMMDSNDLERERGITILAKCTAVDWEGVKINIIDTPGHADFGGEVERILHMADGVLLLVDASEGAMPQTKFVLAKALKIGLNPIVIINKVDRPDRRVDEVVNEVFDLFVSLDANDKQLDFPILYASGRNGWAARSLEAPRESLVPLMEEILAHVPAPTAVREKPFSMLATLLSADPYLGRILTGRIATGIARVNTPFKSIDLNGNVVETGRLTKLFTFKGLLKIPVEEAYAGDIIAVAGVEDTQVSNTICDPSVEIPLKSTPIDPPTIAITLGVNDSPYAGTEGKKVTSRVIRDRLYAEAETNVAITLKDLPSGEAFEVGGRGELQLGVLIENMRREGFELSVSRPRVLFKKDTNGNIVEPYEEVVVDVDEAYSGIVVEKISIRKGEMQDMRPSGAGKMRIVFIVPSRGLIGYQGEFMTDTRGTGIINRIFHSYGAYKGDLAGRRNGVLIAIGFGETEEYALFGLQDRGEMFVGGREKVYDGMIIGEHNRENDLEVNVLKAKQLTNFRTTMKDDATNLTPPRQLTLESMIAYIQDDELVEVTPQNLRIRKRYLDPNLRKRMGKAKIEVVVED